ncbi:YoaK family protein [Clostridium sp. Marseille-P2415]|uniref:YoaK family protein n=1 Tax=Clostridium sp. Marseille-P2415 TaxID=1805471 RepID=UPI001F3813CF|nr:YoaK family protein [Clostridium sp. Marseille-P2415]
MIQKKKHGQMSEAVSTGIILTLSGGLQDAYTYYFRGKVFANAQTGNIIILSSNVMDGNWQGAFHYILPILAFASGIYVSEIIRGIFKELNLLHWRQIVVMIEILLLLLVGFLPQSFNMAANALVSFVCAMQVEAFRKMKGSAFASTMCIGNLRSATEMLYRHRHTKERGSLEKCLRYYGVIAIFAIGAGAGSFLIPYFAEKTIWFSCALLIAAFCMMFIREESESERN